MVEDLQSSLPDSVRAILKLLVDTFTALEGGCQFFSLMIRFGCVPKRVIGFVLHPCPKPCASMGEISCSPDFGSLRFQFQSSCQCRCFQGQHELS